MLLSLMCGLIKTKEKELTEITGTCFGMFLLVIAY